MRSGVQTRRTKIIATVGPASGDEPVLGRLVDEGVDVFRINSSHGSPARWTPWIDSIRRVAEQAGKHVGILLDLQGPRIRVGQLPEPRMLEYGSEIVFAPESAATGVDIPTTYDALARDVRPGSTILLNDGLLAAEVTQIEGVRVRAVVRQGGELTSNKGMNLPGSLVSAPTLTAADRENLAAGVARGVDFVGISFVRRAEDVESVRSLVPVETSLVAKVETTAAIEDYSQLLDVSDGIMVARGDLGVEIPFEEVPLMQKQLLRRANQQARPTITATQMLESMVRNARPTRAEASDVANAVLDGTDAVMLSAETAIGEYPLEAVRAMARICREIEEASLEDVTTRTRRDRFTADAQAVTVADAIAYATTAAAEMLGVPVIACFTRSGFTARKIASYRPATPIVGLSSDVSTCRTLSMVWGVTPILVQAVSTYEDLVRAARDALLKRGIVKAGEPVAVTAGVPFNVPGTTDLLKVEVF